MAAAEQRRGYLSRLAPLRRRAGGAADCPPSVCRAQQYPHNGCAGAGGVRGEKAAHAAGTASGYAFFQALRIAVNDELAHLQKGLAAARQVLVAGGRLVVIAFHSLEDRLVKKLAVSPALPGIGRVGVTDLCPIGRMRRPAAAEVAANPRARSACMRVFSKVEAVPV